MKDDVEYLGLDEIDTMDTSVRMNTIFQRSPPLSLTPRRLDGPVCHASFTCWVTSASGTLTRFPQPASPSAERVPPGEFHTLLSTAQNTAILIQNRTHVHTHLCSLPPHGLEICINIYLLPKCVCVYVYVYVDIHKYPLGNRFQGNSFGGFRVHRLEYLQCYMRQSGLDRHCHIIHWFLWNHVHCSESSDLTCLG